MQTTKRIAPRTGKRPGRPPNPARLAKPRRGELWVAVKVERGFIAEAQVFESEQAAEQTGRKWRARLNPDYDEAAVLKRRLIPCRATSS